MARLTKSQQKRLVIDARKKFQKIYNSDIAMIGGPSIISVNDLIAIDKLCKKFLQRIG
tara:strand:+ start:152 stop:325 length:174 start_codon:yes stop_codon:yes gene_type:complete